MAPNSPHSKHGNQDSAPLEDQEQIEHPTGSAEPTADTKQQPKTPDELADAEDSAAQSGAQESNAVGGSFYRPAKTTQSQVGRGYRQTPPSRAAAKTWASRHKKQLIIGGSGATLLLLPIILILSFLLPSLKLPQLAAEIEGYRLARLSRTFYNEASLLTSDKSFVDATGQPTTADLVGKTPLGKALSLYKPTRVINNMKATGVLDFDYSGNTLKNIVINGEKIPVPDYKYRSLRDLKNNYNERIRFAAEVKGSINQVLDGSNFLVRSKVAQKILRANGINLLWWEKQGSQYKNLSQQAADRLALRQAEEQIATPSTDGVKTSSLQNAGDDANAALQKCLENDPCTDEAIRDNGLPPEVTNTITNDTVITNGQKALGIINPTYAALFPVCIAYDASTDAANTFLNSQNVAAMKTFFAVASGSDQLKNGGVYGGAIQAFNRRIGNIGDSYIGQISRGNKNVDTSAEVSPQAGRSGEFSMFNAFAALFGGDPNSILVRTANAIADHACPIATNLGVSIGLGVLNGALAVFSLGTSEEAEAPAEASAQGLVATIGSKITSLVTEATGRAAIKNTAKDYAIGTVKTGATVDGLSYLSRMIVLSEMGAFINGMDSNDFANQADMGAVAYGNQMNQQQMFGRPLTQSEVSGVETEDASYASAQNNAKSSFTRNFAITNPYSPVGKIAMAISSWRWNDVSSLFTNLPHLVSSIFSPATHLFGHAVAASNTNDNYGMVQFGYSTAEENLINNDPSYDPLINAEIVADSGQAPAIATKYAKCFGYSYDASTDSLAYDPTQQIGNLLSGGNPSIQRDKNGNVINSGDCAPSKLTIGNAEFDNNLCVNDPALSGVKLANGNSCNNLVFRWRLDQSYQNVQNELNGVQDPSDGSTTPGTGGSTTGGTGGSGSLPTGGAQDLANQLLPYINNGTIQCAGDGQGNIGCSDITNTAQGINIPHGEGCTVSSLSSNLLGMILELVKMGHKFIFSALCSDHHDDGVGGHATGQAADFNTVDGVFLGAGEDAAGTIHWQNQGALGQQKIDVASKLDQDVASFMPPSTGFGQIQCHPSFSFLSGFVTFDDGCTHQHIQVAN